MPKKPLFPALAVCIVLILAGAACNLPTVPDGPGDAASTPTAAPESSEVRIYMVALDDNGASGPLVVGCGDSLVEVRREIPPTTQPLRAALEELLAQKDQYYGESGLYNALYQSNLSVQSAAVMEESIATVELTGQLVVGGTCDAPRVKAQIVQTILGAGEFSWAEVFINGQPIDEVLSQE